MRGPLDRSNQIAARGTMSTAKLGSELTGVSLSMWLRNILRALGLLSDPGAWIEPDYVLVCAYPRSHRALLRLHELGIRRLLNLHERSHDPGRLPRYGLLETHVPMADFGAPTPAELATALSVIHAARRAGAPIAVHCGGGLGRSGTVAACYLVEHGQDWRAAVARVRAVRPGAIETRAQLTSVAAYAEGRVGSRGERSNSRMQLPGAAEPAP
jgi:atypical dual specificity phosphatase